MTNNCRLLVFLRTIRSDTLRTLSTYIPREKRRSHAFDRCSLAQIKHTQRGSSLAPRLNHPALKSSPDVENATLWVAAR